MKRNRPILYEVFGNQAKARKGRAALSGSEDENAGSGPENGGLPPHLQSGNRAPVARGMWRSHQAETKPTPSKSAKAAKSAKTAGAQASKRQAAAARSVAGAGAKGRAPTHEARARSSSGPSDPMRELRISYEVMAVIGILVVVLCGLLYYFGTRQANTGVDPTLAVRDTTQGGPSSGNSGGNGLSTPNGGADADPGYETFWSVRVCSTGGWNVSDPKEAERIESAALKIVDVLEERGFRDVLAIARYFPKNNARRYIAIYVGKADEKDSLKGLLGRLRGQKLPGANTSGAYPTTLTLPK